MAATNPPPQAYTKETVTQAYEWLFSQPQNIREMAADLDTMVALFLQARRRRSSAGVSTNPVSAKAFKDELKGLAENFKQFEPPSQAQNPAQQNMAHQVPTHQSMSHPTSAHQGAAAAPQAPEMPAPQMTYKSHSPSNLTQLDEKSVQLIRRVMESLNLSSEDECLRLLLSLGYEKVREILPKN